MATVLLVEDDAPMADGLRYNLERAGHRVVVAPDGPSGVTAAAAERPDLVVLDLMLPGLDGFGVLARLRGGGARPPVIVLSALGDEATKIRGLDLGADDFVTKPFGVGELLARIRRRLGEVAATAAAEIALSDGVADLARREVRRGDTREPLTPTEVAILAHLARRPGHPVAREELLAAVWGATPADGTRTLDTHVARLRRKIEPDPARPRHLVTVHAVGYRLDPALPQGRG